MSLSDEERDFLEVLAAVILFLAAAWGLYAHAEPPADAPRAVNVTRARLVQVDGGVLDVDGGAWFCDDVVMARARELEEARLRPLATEASVALIVTTALVSAGAGAAVACWATTGDALCRKP